MKPQQYTREPRNHTNKSIPKQIGHTSVNESEIRFWKAGLLPPEALEFLTTDRWVHIFKPSTIDQRELHTFVSTV